MVHSTNIIRIIHRLKGDLCSRLASLLFTQHLNQQVVQPFNPMTAADTISFYFDHFLRIMAYDYFTFSILILS